MTDEVEFASKVGRTGRGARTAFYLMVAFAVGMVALADGDWHLYVGLAAATLTASLVGSRSARYKGVTTGLVTFVLGLRLVEYLFTGYPVNYGRLAVAATWSSMVLALVAFASTDVDGTA